MVPDIVIGDASRNLRRRISIDDSYLTHHCADGIDVEVFHLQPVSKAVPNVDDCF
jgi:hypothetical protein